MSARAITPLIAGIAVAAAVGFAPTAAATTNVKDCDSRGGASVCVKTGHASINASPEATQPGNSTWPFGAGPNPPIWAFD